MRIPRVLFAFLALLPSLACLSLSIPSGQQHAKGSLLVAHAAGARTAKVTGKLHKQRHAASGHNIAHSSSGAHRALRKGRHSMTSRDQLLSVAERQVETANTEAAEVLGRLVWGALPSKDTQQLTSELEQLGKLNSTLTRDLALLSKREQDVSKHDLKIAAYLKSQLPRAAPSGKHGRRQDELVLSYVQNHTRLAQTQLHAYLDMSRNMVEHIGSLTELYTSALEGKKVNHHKLAQLRVELQNTLLTWPGNEIDQLHAARQSYAKEKLPKPGMALLRAAIHVEQH